MCGRGVDWSGVQKVTFLVEVAVMLSHDLSALKLDGEHADPVAGVVTDFLMGSFSDQFIDGIIG